VENPIIPSPSHVGPVGVHDSTTKKRAAWTPSRVEMCSLWVPASV
jgi:hypothetical protein